MNIECGKYKVIKDIYIYVCALGSLKVPNGCVGCCTDIAFKDNHMSVLRQTHPKRWEQQMKSGLGEELIALYKYKGNGKVNYLSIARNVGDALDMRPCAFDDLGERIISDQITSSKYDSEMDGQKTIEEWLESSTEEG